MEGSVPAFAKRDRPLIDRLPRKPPERDQQIELRAPHRVLGERRGGFGVAGDPLGVDDLDVRRRAELEGLRRDPQDVVGLLGGQR